MYFKEFLAAAAIGVCALPAFAADLPSTKSAPVFAPPPAFSWTGFYVGVNAGAALGDSAFADPIPLNGTGFLGGATIGYNWESASHWVLGAEATFDYRGSIGGGSGNYGVTGGLTAYDTKSGFLGTFGPRLGYAWDRLLVYGTGGLAYGDVPVPSRFSGPTYSGYAIGSQPFEPGWMAGGGVEYALTNNWAVSVQYTHVHLQHTMPVFATTTQASDPICETSRFNLITAGLVYKFDAPIATPVVAKY